ncbi:MAG TPA: nuclear transport factor 2 family protein [Acidimicrobiia bacterium]|nr:nuclear transport factor 2 family protein [Acidimicrobiia bacterium]
MASLEELSAQLAIRDLLGAFADAVNRMRPDDLRPLFTDDGEWVVTGFGHPRGHDAIVAFLDDLLVKWAMIFHAIHSGRVTLAGDRATGEWYISEFGQLRDGTEVRIAGVYHDDYACGGDGRWRFARRRYDGMFSRFGRELKVRPYPADLLP